MITVEAVGDCSDTSIAALRGPTIAPTVQMVPVATAIAPTVATVSIVPPVPPVSSTLRRLELSAAYLNRRGHRHVCRRWLRCVADGSDSLGVSTAAQTVVLTATKALAVSADRRVSTLTVVWAILSEPSAPG